MVRQLCTWLVLALSCYCSSLAAKEKLLVEIPEQWLKVVERQVGQLSVSEYVPADTTDQWQEKVVLEALAGDELPDPLDYVDGLVNQQRQVCDQLGADAVFAGFENGYPTAVELMQCRRNHNTGRPLVTMVKIIKGNDALYTVSRFWRLPEVPAAAADTDPRQLVDIQESQIAAWSNRLRSIKLCDATLDAHPCDQ